MKIWHGLDAISVPFPATSVAIGVFDGIHVGHQALISAAVADARAHGREAVVFTFDRHPAELIAPEKAPAHITTPEQRARLVEALGVDHLVIARFDERFRDLSPEGFLRFVVKGVLGAQAVFVGFDFRFGRNQSGDPEHLRAAAERFHFDVTVLDPVLVAGEKASSSRIREHLRAGELDAAATMLGRRFVLTGEVVEGQKLGRQLGYPTANLQLHYNQIVPADGIYATRVGVLECWSNGVSRSQSSTPPLHHSNAPPFLGACSIGLRPTVGGTERTIEVYLLDFSGDLYGQTINLEFVHRLRDELKFNSLEALTTQIAADVARVRELL